MDSIEVIAFLLYIVAHPIAAMIIGPAVTKPPPDTGAMGPFIRLGGNVRSNDGQYKKQSLSAHVCKVCEKVRKTEIIFIYEICPR
jgi:hypothetical protein